MDNTTFENLVKEIRTVSMDTLTAKNAKYATESDRLHNFVVGGDVMGGTAAQACWGYLTKHLVALRDKVERNDFSDREDLREKCQDTINYIVFLWCIGNEERAKKVREDTARRNHIGDAPLSNDCGLGLTPEERKKYEADGAAKGTVTYRDMAKRLAPKWVDDACYLGGVRNCPGTLLENAPRAHDGTCKGGVSCFECWNQPYKGERARDNVGGD